LKAALVSRISVEELANSVTHGVGLALSAVGFAVLLVLAVIRGGAWQIASCTIYGSTLICLYAASTLYHGATSSRWKRALKIFDHCAIYLLIAGTYTPFTLVNLRGGWGWSLFGAVWCFALAGILFKLWFVDHFKILSPLLYIAMGWLALVAVRPMLAKVPLGGIGWLVSGGVLYTIGAIFFASPKIRYHHAIWHVFVMAGSVCHYIAVLYSVVLSPRA
jgi:hemolysin III